MSEILKEVTEWYNNNVAIANSSGLITMIVAFFYMYLSNKSKKKEKAIKIDVSTASNDVKQLTSSINQLVDNQVKNNRALQRINEMVFTFSQATSITPDYKQKLLTLYTEVKNDVIDLSKEAKQVIEETVEKAKETIEETKEEIKEVVEKSKSITDKYWEELKTYKE